MIYTVCVSCVFLPRCTVEGEWRREIRTVKDKRHDSGLLEGRHLLILNTYLSYRALCKSIGGSHVHSCLHAYNR